MLPRFRPATPTEIEKLAPTSDLGPGTSVLALDNESGDPDFFVLRQCYEIDPAHYAPTSNHRRRAMAVAMLENMLAFSGVPAYYFNVPVRDEEYLATVKHWGAEQVSAEPELRFKRDLNVHQATDTK